MGTPEFAVPSLEQLKDDQYEIAAVFTQPDRKSGRGHKVCTPPVKQFALKYGIPVFQFEKIKSAEGVAAIAGLAPDMIVTAAFGQLLSKEILEIPRFGCINVHASLLPKYRGAAPIQWAIINGESRTGITIMYMDEGLDTGDIIMSSALDIDEKTTGGTLYRKLAVLGASVLCDALKAIKDGSATRTPQDETQSSYFPPLSKKNAQINWNKSAREIANLVRALDPFMGAAAHMEGQPMKIWSAEAAEGDAKPGEIVCADVKTGLLAGTGDGLLRILEIQAPCCKRMPACDFFCGRKLPAKMFDISGAP